MSKGMLKKGAADAAPCNRMSYTEPIFCQLCEDVMSGKIRPLTPTKVLVDICHVVAWVPRK